MQPWCWGIWLQNRGAIPLPLGSSCHFPDFPAALLVFLCLLQGTAQIKYLRYPASKLFSWAFIKGKHFGKAVYRWNGCWGKRSVWRESWKCVCLSLVPSDTGRDRERNRSHGDCSDNMKRKTQEQLYFSALLQSWVRWSCLIQVHIAFVWIFWHCDSFTGQVIIFCPRESYWGRTCHENKLLLREPSHPCGLVPAQY